MKVPKRLHMPAGGDPMAKSQDTKPTKKKPPQKTAKEKKQAKKEKKKNK